jgi:putative hydrolase of the HAD superfamily
LIRTIIFDVGGTLVDAPDLFFELSKEIGSSDVKECSEEIKKEFFRMYSGKEFYSVKEMLKMAMEKVVLERSHNSSAHEKAAQIYEKTYLYESHLFDGVKQVLERIKERKIRMMIVSDADSDVLIPELANLGIKEYFDEIMISSDIKAYKPNEMVVSKIISCMDEEPDHVLFVGDSAADIETAKKLGVRSASVNTDKDIGADYRLKDIKELQVLLDEINTAI